MFSIAKPELWHGEDAAALRTFLETDTGKKFRAALSAEVPSGAALFHDSTAVTTGVILGVNRVIDTIFALVRPPEKVEEAGGLPDLNDDSKFNPDNTLKTS